MSNITFKRNIIKMGASIGITIPPELKEYLELTEEDEIGLIGDQSKHGKFIGIWKIKKEE